MNSALLMLVDGRFPAGGHTNSAGVEAAVRIGDVHDDATLERYLLGRLATTGVVDAAFAAHVTALGDTLAEPDVSATVDAELSARLASPALRAASRRFGRQLCRAASGVWTSPALDALVHHDRGAHQAVVLGAAVSAAGGTSTDAAALAFHHLSAAVTSSGVRLLGLDPMTVAASQARVGLHVDAWLAQAATWATSPVSDLPADGGSLTEILAQDHAARDARLFVA